MSPITDLAKHPETYVTVAELARYWRVAERTVQYQVQKGALPATRVGRSIRIRTVDARAFGRIEDVVTGPVASAK
jgi:excisionase family DNA binding protein